MSNIKNNENKVEEKIEINRAQIEHRAFWLGLIYDEMIKAKIDAEPIIRKAIKRCGKIHGEIFKRLCANPKDCNDFRNAFLGDVGVNTFNMDSIKSDEGNVTVDFHYCALVNAWKKLGFNDKTCEKLCDIAMDGDRGIAEAMGLEFTLTDTIAKGNDVCKLHFHK